MSDKRYRVDVVEDGNDVPVYGVWDEILWRYIVTTFSWEQAEADCDVLNGFNEVDEDE